MYQPVFHRKTPASSSRVQHQKENVQSSLKVNSEALKLEHHKRRPVKSNHSRTALVKSGKPHTPPIKNAGSLKKYACLIMGSQQIH